MAWDVDVTLVDDWLNELGEDSHDQVVATIRILQRAGPALGRPMVDSVKGLRHRNMKE